MRNYQQLLQAQLVDNNISAWENEGNLEILELCQNNDHLKKKIGEFMDKIFDDIIHKKEASLTNKGKSEVINNTGNLQYEMKFSFQTLQFEVTPNQVQIEENLKIDFDKEIKTRKGSQNLSQNKSLTYFCRVLQIIDLVVDGITHNRFRSKREIYYSHTDLFEKQENVNSIIKKLSFILQVPRRSLKLVSASKGLCAGALILRNYKDQVEIDLGFLSKQGKGLNITEFMDNWDEIEVYGKRILVVEKETIYFRLLEEGNEDFLNQYFLVTGKGYPCRATQSFLKLVSQKNPTKPVYYLGDIDPHGFDIVCQYAFGTQESMFERNNVPWIHWLGMNMEITDSDQGIPLALKERVLLENLNKRSYFQDPQEEPDQASTIQYQIWQTWMCRILGLLEVNYKYELEALVPQHSTLTQFCVSLIQHYEDNFDSFVEQLMK